MDQGATNSGRSPESFISHRDLTASVHDHEPTELEMFVFLILCPLSPLRRRWLCFPQLPPSHWPGSSDGVSRLGQPVGGCSKVVQVPDDPPATTNATTQKHTPVGGPVAPPAAETPISCPEAPRRVKRAP